jgi:U4/U6.U5 tri-snRNP-associated protein 3
VNALFDHLESNLPLFIAENQRDRSRSPYRANRDRSRSPYRGNRNRERSRSPYRPNRSEQRGRSPPRGPKSNPHRQDPKPAPASVQAPLPDENLDPEEYMRRLMGFSGFRSTKNTKVPGNDSNYGVRIDKETRYRQYMNRTKGFNRPLSPVRPRRKGDQT